MKQSSIILGRHDKWVKLSLSLGEDLPAGQCSYIKGNFLCNVKNKSGVAPTDESIGWGIAVLSGARYAFRIMNSVHKELIIHSVEGVMGEEDVEGLSSASAIVIVSLLGGDIASVATGEWRELGENKEDCAK